jgi:hypothetical protein
MQSPLMLPIGSVLAQVCKKGWDLHQHIAWKADSRCRFPVFFRTCATERKDLRQWRQ